MPNRVRELETAVAQLQATVDGLRDELVDANERIRALEQERETETPVDDGSSEVPFALLDPADGNGSDETVNVEEEPATVEDIIVA